MDDTILIIEKTELPLFFKNESCNHNPNSQYDDFCEHIDITCLLHARHVGECPWSKILEEKK